MDIVNLFNNFGGATRSGILTRAPLGTIPSPAAIPRIMHLDIKKRA